MELRDYQIVDIDRLRDAYRKGARAPIYQLATGGGKTIVFSHVIKGAVAKGTRVLVLAHRRELIKQASAKLTELGVVHGIMAAGQDRDHDAQVIVASIQTIARRLHLLPLFGLIVIDEAHHAVAKTWSELLGGQPGAKLLGVTATPARLDGKGLGTHCGGHFDSIVCGPPMQELVDRGYLAECEVYVPAASINVRGLRTIAGDYDEGELEKRAEGVTGDCVAEYLRHRDAAQCVGLGGGGTECEAQRRAASPATKQDAVPGFSGIAFCVTVRHAESVAQAFRDAGIRSTCVHGAMNKAKRDAAIAGLSTGEVEVLTSCEIISEGLDVPSVAIVILLRPTKSLTLCLQQVGRGMRPKADGGKLIVLDHARNCLTHGLPTETRNWSLDGVDRDTSKKPPEPWTCLDCGVLNSPARQECKACGALKPWVCQSEDLEGRICGEINPGDTEECEACGAARRRRHIPVEDNAEMRVLAPDAFAHIYRLNYYQLIGHPRTEAEVAAYARHRGYKPGWTYHFMREQTLRFAPV
jgi:DNA repair protein RadD